MSRHSLRTNGLSLSQAQSLSNICNQRAREIDAQLDKVNNFEKRVRHEGQELVISAGKPLPPNVVELLLQKAKNHSLQAFLMFNIKEKDRLIKDTKTEAFVFGEPPPKMPEIVAPVAKKAVTEEEVWDTLSPEQYNDFLICEAYASHIGQFIHKDGILTRLRDELPNIPAIQWLELTKDQKTPVEIKKHHTPEELMRLYETLAETHREYEQKVNYYKALVKNKTTETNAAIAKENADAVTKHTAETSGILTDYRTAMAQWEQRRSEAGFHFERGRQEKVRQLAAARIEIPSVFQELVDSMLPKTAK